MSDYLWDRSGPVDPEIAALEARLRPLAFDPSKRPLPLPRTPDSQHKARPPRRTIVRLAIAASVLLVAGLYGFHTWRLSWPDGRAWRVDRGASSLAPGSALVADDDGARVAIARLGVLEAQPGTHLTLVFTSNTRHRLALDRGEIDVRVWAPPGRVVVNTPAGEVVDLGCIFRLTVGDDQATRLSVSTGWVLLDNVYGEQSVPAGASSEMHRDRAPGIAVFDDAAESFRRAVREVETNTQAPDASMVRIVTSESRVRDAFTVITLARLDGLPADVRSSLLERVAVLHAPPSPDAIARILAGDRDMYWQWHDSLPLPALKNWWVNWSDIFPRRLR